MTTTTQHAIDLMPQLRDILQLPADLDLPQLSRVVCEASLGEPGWQVRAQLRHLPTDQQRWDALKAWASGAAPVLGDPHAGSHMPSGVFRQASVTVAVAEVAVEIWCHVDGEFVPPKPEPVRVTGAFADFLLGEDVTA